MRAIKTNAQHYFLTCRYLLITLRMSNYMHENERVTLLLQTLKDVKLHDLNGIDNTYIACFSIAYLLDQRVYFMQVCACGLQSNAFKLNIHFLKPYRIYYTVEPSLYGHLFV